MTAGSGEPRSPAELWQQARDERPDDDSYRERYRELLREHGHLVERQPGDDGNLPCGWPGEPRSNDGTPTGPWSAWPGAECRFVQLTDGQGRRNHLVGGVVADRLNELDAIRAALLAAREDRDRLSKIAKVATEVAASSSVSYRDALDALTEYEGLRAERDAYRDQLAAVAEAGGVAPLLADRDRRIAELEGAQLGSATRAQAFEEMLAERTAERDALAAQVRAVEALYGGEPPPVWIADTKIVRVTRYDASLGCEVTASLLRVADVRAALAAGSNERRKPDDFHSADSNETPASDAAGSPGDAEPTT